MKIAIFRTDGSDVNLSHYNSQEAGLGRALLEKGHSVDIYTAKQSNDSASRMAVEVIATKGGSELRLIRLGYKNIPVLDYGVFTGAREAINKESYDLVHINEENNPASALLALYCAWRKVPYVIYHGMYTLPTGKARQLYERCHGLFFRPFIIRTVKSTFCKTSLARTFLQERGYKRASVMPVGLDTGNFDSSLALKPDWLHGIEQRFNKLALYVGVFEKRRNIDFLLDLGATFPEDQCLLLVGQGPLYEHAQKRVEKEKLERVIIQPSLPQKELLPVYKAADVFLLASDYEIYGMVLLEALYFGVPIVCSRTGGAEDIVSMNGAGTVLDGYNVESWSDAINEITNQQDEQQWHWLTELLEKKYRWSGIVSDYLERVN